MNAAQGGNTLSAPRHLFLPKVFISLEHFLSSYINKNFHVSLQYCSYHKSSRTCIMIFKQVVKDMLTKLND